MLVTLKNIFVNQSFEKQKQNTHFHIFKFILGLIHNLTPTIEILSC